MEVALDTTRCAEHVSRLRSLLDEALAGLVPAQEPAALYEPVRYVLDGGGKRLRPVLLLLAAETFGVDVERALPAALAVEVFHNFTLVHDDIMDHAEARRGRPAVHVRWSEETALLCGDYLLALSYDLLARLETDHLPALLRAYGRMVFRLCEGQALDKAFETRPGVSVDDYLRMIDAKTGALMRAVLELGGLLGGASEAHLEALRAAAGHVGRAFQIQDDLLDLVADDDRWGKSVGGDLMEGKKTFLLLRALERAQGQEHEWFARISRAGGLPGADVPEARRRMERRGVLDDARPAVLRHTTTALEHLDALPPADAVESLRWLIRRLQARLH